MENHPTVSRLAWSVASPFICTVYRLAAGTSTHGVSVGLGMVPLKISVTAILILPPTRIHGVVQLARPFPGPGCRSLGVRIGSEAHADGPWCLRPYALSPPTREPFGRAGPRPFPSRWLLPLRAA